MKRKHWQGYGTVNAKAIRKSNTIYITVTGTHECGLAIPYHDKYRLAEWLGIKSLGNFKAEDVISFSTTNISDTECLYTVIIKEAH